MFKLSKKADYALVALSHLQRKNAPASAKEIAQTYNLSNQMLANVLKSLSNAGLLISKRGTLGGYNLSRQPGQISLGEVITLFEGEKSFSDCSSMDKDCVSAAQCPARRPVLMIHRKIKDFVDGISLADLANHREFAKQSI